MSRILILKPYTIEAYLALEERSEARHEFLAGHLLELPGSSERHSLIKNAICDRLRAHLRGSGHRVYASAMKVRVGNAFYYPDVVVSSAPFDPESVYLTSPLLIVAVASEASKARDLLEKRVAYQSLPSLRVYAVVFDYEQRIEVFRRLPDGWEQETSLAGEVFRLACIDLDTAVGDLYRDFA